MSCLRAAGRILPGPRLPPATAVTNGDVVVTRLEFVVLLLLALLLLSRKGLLAPGAADIPLNV